MKAEDIAFEIKAKLTVDKSTAETCLRLVELYVNQTGATIVCDRLPTGEERFYFEHETARNDL